MYELYLERSAERDLKRLSRNDFERIVSRIKILGENPRPPGSRKIAGSMADWRLRVGEYRIIYEIDDAEKAIRVFRVKHRREAYR